MTWYDNNWDYRKLVTINAACVSGNHTNFPTLFKISGIGNKSLPDGTDIVFVDDNDSTRLNHDLISFYDYTGTAWIKIPSLVDNTDKNFYIYYGNTGGGDQTAVDGYKPSGTWSDYIFVSHMKDGTSNKDMTDSSKYQTQLWKTSAGDPEMISSFLGSAQKWDNETTAIISSNLTEVFNNISSQLSVETIASGSLYNANFNYIVSFHNIPTNTGVHIMALYVGLHNNSINAITSGTLKSITDNWTDNYFASSSYYLPTTRTSYLGYSFLSGSYIKSFDAGVNTGLDTANSTDFGNLSETNYGIVIGNRPAGARRYSGSILELRVTKENRNLGWFKTGYLNISSLSVYRSDIFYEVGLEEEGSSTEKDSHPGATHYYFPYYFSDIDGIHFTGAAIPEPPLFYQPKYEYDLAIFYNSLEGDDYLDCRCSRWDVQDYSIIVETWLTKSQINTLLENIRPGATSELYNILGRPHYYDKTWTKDNTIKLYPTPSSVSMNTSTLRKMRRETLIYPKNVSLHPIKNTDWIECKIEGFISGTGNL